MKEKLQQGVKKNKFSYFFHTSLLQVKMLLKCFLFSSPLSRFRVPSDYSVKEQLIIANYYVIKW